MENRIPSSAASSTCPSATAPTAAIVISVPTPTRPCRRLRTAPGANVAAPAATAASSSPKPMEERPLRCNAQPPRSNAAARAASCSSRTPHHLSGPDPGSVSTPLAAGPQHGSDMACLGGRLTVTVRQHGLGQGSAAVGESVHHHPGLPPRSHQTGDLELPQVVGYEVLRLPDHPGHVTYTQFLAVEQR